MWDWIEFLDRNQIAYQRDGQKQLSTRCPFCGPLDEKGHDLAINVEGKGWRCWRQPKQHYGVSPTRLVAAFLNCSFEHAAAITGHGKTPPPDNFESRIDTLVKALLGEEKPQRKEPLKWPEEFRPIDETKLSQPFVLYLARRGFTHPQIMTMTQQYDLHCCRYGPFRYRVIFPIRHKRSLVAWTGRTIVEGEERRYWAEGPAPHYLLWFDELCRGGDCIALTEGPFDALKCRMLGLPATCLFTASPSDQQIGLLYDLLPRYKRRVLLLDREALTSTRLTESRLRAMEVETIDLPPRYKDPACINSAKELRSILTPRHVRA